METKCGAGLWQSFQRRPELSATCEGCMKTGRVGIASPMQVSAGAAALDTSLTGLIAANLALAVRQHTALAVVM